VLLQRLTPAERAVLLLHQVFDFSHGEIDEILDRTQRRADNSSDAAGHI